jgi:cobalamin biosynthesis Co2+ chelatase CbiK
MNESGEIYQVEINTTDKTYHKIFDERLEERLLNTLHSIPSEKFEEIISNVYTNFMNKNNNEEKILKLNRKSIKENSKEEEIRYTNFV